MDDDDLLEALGVSVETKTTGGRTPRQERIIAGFEDILAFAKEHGRAPEHGEDRDIFERLYAVRLDRLRDQVDCRQLLAKFDTHGLLDTAGAPQTVVVEDLDDAGLLAELGIETAAASDITKLKHVKPREEIRAAEEIAIGRFAPISRHSSHSSRG